MLITSGVSKYVSKCFIHHGMHLNSCGWCIMTEFIGTGELQVNTDFTVSMLYSLQSNVLTLNIGTFRIAIFEDKINDGFFKSVRKVSFYYLFQKKSESNNLIKHEFSSYFLKHCCIYRFINAVCWLLRCEQDESPVEFLTKVLKFIKRTPIFRKL